MSPSTVRIRFAAVLSVSLWTLAAPEMSGASAELRYAPAPVDNPLKGFVPYDGPNTNFPHSLEFFYLPVSAVQTDYAEFEWSPLERKLQGIASRGHQAVLRFYLDYPNLPSGLPPFVRHVPVKNYDDWGNGTSARSVSPDYEHPDLRRALTNFVAALGGRYDADPRVGFITVGLLGFWGEWHTYPYNGFERPNWFASAVVQREVLDAFAAAFQITPLLLREPKPGVNIASRRLGFHDDSFAYSTLGPEAWHFWPALRSYGLTNVWRKHPIGGEIRPELWNCIWDEPSCAPAGQEFFRSVETTHASWLLDSGTFRGITGPRRERALAGARRLGYELFVNWASLPSSAIPEQPLQLTVTVTNTGVAPFYYRWPVVFGLHNASGIVRQWTNLWDLTTVQPNEPPLPFALKASLDGLPLGRYAALLSVPNPLPGGNPLRFANETQDATLPGWLTLGTLDIRAAPKLGPPVLREGRLEMEIQGLRLGSATEVQRAAPQPTGEWEVIDAFAAPAPQLIWSRMEPPGGAAYFRVQQWD